MPLPDSSFDQLCTNLRILLKERREDLGLSMNQVAKMAGLNRMAVSFIESGLRIPSISTYARLAVALGVSPSELLLIAERQTTSLFTQEDKEKDDG